MALDTYSDLKASIASWLKRTDLTNNVPDFVRLAETRINRELRVRLAEVESSVNGVIGSRFIPLPSDYSVPIGMFLTTYNPRFEMTQVLAKQLNITTAAGRPNYWAVDGLNIAFERPCDVGYSFAFRYGKNFQLTDANPSNEILANHPDVYLFGGLVEGAIFTMDDKQTAIWEQKFQNALDSAKNQEVDSYNTAQLRTDDMVNPKRFNIYTGY